MAGSVINRRMFLKVVGGLAASLAIPFTLAEKKKALLPMEWGSLESTRFITSEDIQAAQDAIYRAKPIIPAYWVHPKAYEDPNIQINSLVRVAKRPNLFHKRRV